MITDIVYLNQSIESFGASNNYLTPYCISCYQNQSHILYFSFLTQTLQFSFLAHDLSIFLDSSVALERSMSRKCTVTILEHLTCLHGKYFINFILQFAKLLFYRLWSVLFIDYYVQFHSACAHFCDRRVSSGFTHAFTVILIKESKFIIMYLCLCMPVLLEK